LAVPAQRVSGKETFYTVPTLLTYTRPAEAVPML